MAGVVFVWFGLSANAQSQTENIRIHGYARNYTGILLNDMGDYSILQNTLSLELSARGNKTAFFVNPYLYHYFDDELELGLREAYLSMYFDNFDLTVGRQQIIYGKAEGVFITDVVSPKDMREFLLPDFEEIRMGVSAFTLNYYRGSHTLEMVWIPVFSSTREPEEGSIWRPQREFPASVTWDYSTRDVPTRMENSELFFRYSTLGANLDLELVGGYFWDDDPALHMTRHFDPETGTLTSLTARPEHHRLLMGGGSFSMPVNGWVIRGEMAYYNGKHFQTSDPAAENAITEKNYLHYMAGVDFSVGDWSLNTQLIQEYILDHGEEMRQEEFEHTMTFMARRNYLRETLGVELFSYIGLTHGDALLRPSMTYDFADGFEIQVGANIFLGSEGRFGQFKDNDMVYTKIRYSF